MSRRNRGSRAGASVVLLWAVASGGCDRPIAEPSDSPPIARGDRPSATAGPREGISELEPGATLPTAAGQMIYLPIRTQWPTPDGRSSPLAVTVVVRNTDELKPIIVTVIRHRDADGRVVHEYLRPPARLGPRALLEVDLKPAESVAAASSILVEWVADRPVTSPIVEALMLDPTPARAFALSTRGEVIEEKSKPGVPAPR